MQMRYQLWEDQDFRLRRVRLDGRWDAYEWLRLQLEFEGAELFEYGDLHDWAVRPVDAFGRLTFHPACRVHLGYFKKPFSRLKLTSSWDLLLPIRGALNRLAVAQGSHGGYGGRDLGLMISGRLNPGIKLRYYLGAFQGPGFIDGSEEHHRDYLARLQARLFKGLILALNFGHKLFDWEDTGITRTVNMLGADLRWRYRGLTVQLEGDWGDNPEALAGHQLLGGHVIVGYRFRLNDDLALIPAVMLEALDPDLEVDWGTTLRLAGAVNLDYRRVLRVVLYVEGGISKGYYQPAGARDNWVKGRNRLFLQVNLML
jgi:hypothetical protein